MAVGSYLDATLEHRQLCSGRIVSLVLFTGLVMAMLFLPSLVALTGTSHMRWSAMREPKASPRKA